MKIIDYKDEYNSDLDELQKSVWGDGSDTDEIFDKISDYRVRLVVLTENNEQKLIGASVSHEIDNEKYFIDFIIIKEGYQYKGIGSILMQDIITFAIEKSYKEISCEAIGVYGKVNSEKLLKNFKFEKQGYYENYWGKKCPDFFCKQCGKKPCECSMTAYTKFL